MTWNMAVGERGGDRVAGARGAGGECDAPGQSEAHRLRGGVVRLAALLWCCRCSLEHMLVERRHRNTCGGARRGTRRGAHGGEHSGERGV